jgi:hypothetical protein
MKAFDINGDVKFKIKNNQGSFLKEWGGSVAKEVKKCAIKHKLETKPHKFSNGKAAIAKKLTIEILFKDAVIQPHTHFEDDFCTKIVEAIEENVNGMFEAASQDAVDEN